MSAKKKSTPEVSETVDFGTKTYDQVLFGVLEAGLWVGAAGAALLAVLRILFHDGIMLFVWLNSFTLYLYLPAYAALLLAARQRNGPLAALAGFAVLMHLFWIAPDYAPASKRPAAPRHGTLKVFSANLLMINQNLKPALDEIKAADPDVILIQEYSPYGARAFHAAGILEEYPHHVEHPESHSFGTALFSRLPTKDIRVTWVENVPFSEARVQVTDRWVRLVNVHTLPPRIPEYVDAWRKQLAWLTREMRAANEPLLLVGDFNATQHSKFYGEIEKAGGTNLHEFLGRGSATTFPNGRSEIPPIRLDHAFANQDLVPLSIREGTGPGSDHKSLFVTVATAPQSKPN